jgi:hypothetical protein
VWALIATHPSHSRKNVGYLAHESYFVKVGACADHDLDPSPTHHIGDPNLGDIHQRPGEKAGPADGGSRPPTEHSRRNLGRNAIMPVSEALHYRN